MKNWVETGISVKNALKIDVKQHLLNNPQNEGTQLLIEDCVGVWQMDAQEVFNEDWVRSVNAALNLDITGALNRDAVKQIFIEESLTDFSTEVVQNSGVFLTHRFFDTRCQDRKGRYYDLGLH